MILTRISRAIREQNWFAVLLEFVIVVAGVLLAFQISQYAQERSQRAYARDTLARVESEVRTIMRVRTTLRQGVTEQVDHLIAARPVITGDVPAEALTGAQCAAIANSSQLNPAPDEVPSLAEVIGSGALASIDNSDLRRTIADFLSKQASARGWIRLQAAGTSDLTQLFPDMVWFELVPAPEDDDQWNRTALCDLDSMRASRAFRAHLMRNYALARGLEEFTYDFMDEAFADLHLAIDAELGIVHEETPRTAPDGETDA